MKLSPEEWAVRVLDRFDVERFRSSLITWGAKYRREFPWRSTRDPYEILTSEVLLHRTRAEQVEPLFLRLIEAYPSPAALSHATEDELQHLLQSAGLRWRVSLLSQLGRQLVTRFDAVVPRTAEDLQSLPGVGPYIAGAVRCFAFGDAAAILDTNTVRILGRVFGLRINDSSRRSRKLHVLMERLVDPLHPREFNYALLDLGALVCRANLPQHSRCPLAAQCDLAQGLVMTT